MYRIFSPSRCGKALSHTNYNNGRGQGVGRVTARDGKIPLGSARRNFVASTRSPHTDPLRHRPAMTPPRRGGSLPQGGRCHAPGVTEGVALLFPSPVSPAGSGPAPRWGASRTDRGGSRDRFAAERHRRSLTPLRDLRGFPLPYSLFTFPSSLPFFPPRPLLFRKKRYNKEYETSP